MINFLMSDTFVWGLIAIGFGLLAWIWWPKKTVTETLEEVKAEEAAAPAPTPVETVASVAAKKKTAPKKPATPKVASKKAPVKKAAPKKAVKKGKK